MNTLQGYSKKTLSDDRVLLAGGGDAPYMGPYFIKGPSTDTTAGTWTGTCAEISEYKEGLTIIYVPAVAGAATTTLKINTLDAVTCYYTNTTKLTTHFSVGTPIMFTYYNNGWRRADYTASISGTAGNSHLPIWLNAGTFSSINMSESPHNSSCRVLLEVGNEIWKTGSSVNINPSTGTLTTEILKTGKLYAPTTSGGTTYGVGSNGQVLKSNGTTVYWGDGGGSADVDPHNYLPLSGGDIVPTNKSNWGEGIRIHSASNGWATLALCGTDNTGTGGTSANTWSLRAKDGNFYLSKNGSNTTTVPATLRNENNNWSMNNRFFFQNTTEGTTSTKGVATLMVGNNVGVGNAGNARGVLSLGTGYANVKVNLWAYSSAASTDYNYYFQNHGATTYSVGVATANTAVGSTSTPVYVDNKGIIKACTSLPTGGTSGAYLPLAGGTMTGPLKWNDSVALPRDTAGDCFLTINSFANGGTTKWISKDDAKTALGIGSTSLVADSGTASITLSFGSKYKLTSSGSSVIFAMPAAPSGSGGTVSVTNNAPTLSWGGTSTVATINSTAITLTMPANPNTNYYTKPVYNAGLKIGTGYSGSAISTTYDLYVPTVTITQLGSLSALDYSEFKYGSIKRPIILWTGFISRANGDTILYSCSYLGGVCSASDVDSVYDSTDPNDTHNAYVRFTLTSEDSSKSSVNIVSVLANTRSMNAYRTTSGTFDATTSGNTITPDRGSIFTYLTAYNNTYNYVYIKAAHHRDGSNNSVSFNSLVASEGHANCSGRLTSVWVTVYGYLT